MSALSIVILVFVFLETLNVILLYKAPGSRHGNAVGFFKAYDKALADPEIRSLVVYLVRWVAGSKLIFICLLIGILVAGGEEVKVFSIFALIFSIATFYTQLYPVMKEMDASGQIIPKGYSRQLVIMITCFILAFIAALVLYFIL